jgi:hypothetical protein
LGGESLANPFAGAGPVPDDHPRMRAAYFGVTEGPIQLGPLRGGQSLTGSLACCRRQRRAKHGGTQEETEESREAHASPASQTRRRRKSGTFECIRVMGVLVLRHGGGRTGSRRGLAPLMFILCLHAVTGELPGSPRDCRRSDRGIGIPATFSLIAASRMSARFAYLPALARRRTWHAFR